MFGTEGASLSEPDCRNPLRSEALSPAFIDMSEDRRQTSKEPKGIFNRLKKAIRLGSRTIDPEEVQAAKLRAKYTRFRILVIGRANAGKTMLLKRVDNTTEEPSNYDEDKNLVSYWFTYRDIPFSSFLHQQLEPTSKVPAR